MILALFTETNEMLARIGNGKEVGGLHRVTRFEAIPEEWTRLVRTTDANDSKAMVFR